MPERVNHGGFEAYLVRLWLTWVGFVPAWKADPRGPRRQPGIKPDAFVIGRFSPSAIFFIQQGVLKMNLIHSLLNVLSGHDAQEAILFEIRRRAGGILLGSVSRLDRVSASELVIYYQNGRLNGSSRIKSTRQTLDRYEVALRSRYPRIAIHTGSLCVDSKRAAAEIELDSDLN